MALFTPAYDTALDCDAYLVDTTGPARRLRLRTELPVKRVVDEILERTVLMGRSLFDVRGRTFALFVGADDGFSLAMSDIGAEGVWAMLLDALTAFGPVDVDPDATLEESGLHPLLAYEEGRVSFFDSAPTRPWRVLAGNRGLRILSATLSHDPDPDVEIRE
ncbi:MAG: hypothetical protein AAGD14_15280 [Planctomycetota bacterium]